MRRLLAALVTLVMVPLAPIAPAAPAQAAGGSNPTQTAGGSNPTQAASWSGPQVSIVNRNGRKVIQLCDQGGACRTTTPFFMAYNSQSPPVGNGDWQYLNYQAQLAAANTAASDMNVAPMLQVHLASTSDAFIDQLAARLTQLNPRPYLMLRFYLQDAPAGAERMRMQDLQGNMYDNTAVGGHEWALSEAWLAYQEQQISRVLTRMDGQYPGRLMSVVVTYGNGGEWFYRPYGRHGTTGQVLEWGDPNLCATANGVQLCGLFPPTNDAGTQPGPRGRHSFYLNDYSTSAQTGFCSWNELPASLVPGCRAATTTERNNAVPGQSPPVSGAARGTVLDPADLNSLRAAKYNQYQSARTATAIARLLATAKQVTGNRILTGAFYGYLYGLTTELSVSGHNALTTLVNSPYVDFLSGPYSYANSRSLGYGFVPQGPPDTFRLANKLWLDEDDTRTLLTRDSYPCYGPPGFKTVTNLWDSIRVLRRNVMTAGIGGRALHFLDLHGCGWFGDPARASDSETLWANLQPVFRAVDKIQLGGANAYQPQIAVFVDDVSPNYQPGLTPAGEHSYEYATDQLPTLVEKLTRLGTPVRHYLLSDLTKGNLDLSAIKLAIVPNAYAVSSALRSAINTKLKTPGRTVLWLYAAGYVQDDQAASTASMSALTDIAVAKGTGTPALTQLYSFVGHSGGPEYGLTPWFRVTDPNATTLGTYHHTSGVSLARKTVAVPGGSYTSVYAAAAKLPMVVLRKLSEDAGVHHFAPVGDTVEAVGNMLLVHAGSSAYKTINLPQTMPRVYETALYPSDVEMCRNCAQLANLSFNQGDTRVFRWTSPPRGNFELLTGSTVEGWAADLDQPAASSAVAVYRGGPAGVGTYLGDFPTATNRPDVNAYFGITGVHGFTFTLSGCTPGTQIHVYALDPEGATGDGSTYLGVRTCT